MARVINGRVVDWADIKIYINGVPAVDVQEINWKTAQEKEHVHTTGVEPVGSAHGNKTYEGDFTLSWAEAERFMAPLRAVGKTPEDLAPFQIVVTWAEKTTEPVPDAPFEVVKRTYSPLRSVTLMDVEITGTERGASQNDKNLGVKFTFIARRIV